MKLLTWLDPSYLSFLPKFKFKAWYISALLQDDSTSSSLCGIFTHIYIAFDIYP